MSPPFGEEPCCSEWLSPLSVRCHHHSVKSHGRVVSGFLKKVRLFLYKERRQLWNITVNRYITRNMQVQFIRFRKKISPLFQCFIQVMFYSMQYRSFTFCEATHSSSILLLPILCRAAFYCRIIAHLPHYRTLSKQNAY